MFRGKPVLYIAPELVNGRARTTARGRKIERASDGTRLTGKLTRATHARLPDAIDAADMGLGFVTREGKQYATYV